LVEARAAYTTASTGPNIRLVPVELDNARIALGEAESSLHDVGDVPATRDLAYIAERRAQQAAAYGNAAASERLLTDRQTAANRNTREELTNTRQQLGLEQQQVAAGQQALSAEQQARADAERRASAAMDALRRVASVREETRGLVITLSGEVLFESGRSVLLPIAQQRLMEVATSLRERHGQSMVVDGFTDSRGSVDSNQALSLARAQAVLAFLVSNGIPADHIRAEGFGPDRPVADNNTAEGRANNRRVEIVVTPAQPQPITVGVSG
jgi:outer membrane protein OmpA-like peptidoglycan-associated protein